MLKLKVGTSFQVLTIEQKAQPTLVHLLKLVKIKIHSRLSSCHSQCNYHIDDDCWNWSCCSTRLFKDMLGNLIYVSQDSCPNREGVGITASCLSGCFVFMYSRQTLGTKQIYPEQRWFDFLTKRPVAWLTELSSANLENHGSTLSGLFF